MAIGWKVDSCMVIDLGDCAVSEQLDSGLKWDDADVVCCLFGGFDLALYVLLPILWRSDCSAKKDYALVVVNVIFAGW